ncbi:MAG: TonB family protein [Limnochordia bacterium]
MKEEILTSDQGPEIPLETVPEKRPPATPAQPPASPEPVTQPQGQPEEEAPSQAVEPSEAPLEGEPLDAEGEEGKEEEGPSGVYEDGEGSEPEPPPPGDQLWRSGGAPVYPKGPQHEDITGEVELTVLVDEQGQIVAVDVVRPSPDPRLDQVARRTVAETWGFRPARQAYRVGVLINFHKDQNAYRVEVEFLGVEYVANVQGG